MNTFFVPVHVIPLAFVGMGRHSFFQGHDSFYRPHSDRITID
jgi:hypothetical protein